MKNKARLLGFALALVTIGCDAEDSAQDEHGDEHGDEHEHDHDHGDDHDHDHETELITTLALTFTAEDGSTVFAQLQDLDGNGGDSATVDTITLQANTTYQMSIELLNEFEAPTEDITPEIREEAEDHFVFVYGPSVTGPASMGDGLLTHAYDDIESDYAENKTGEDLPVGLISTITTAGPGEGRLGVMLRHLPPINDVPQKSADLPQLFADGGTLPGLTDVDADFALTVE